METVLWIMGWSLAGLLAHFIATYINSAIDYSMNGQWRHRSTLAIICSPSSGELLLLIFAIGGGPFLLVLFVVMSIIISILAGFEWFAKRPGPVWTICKRK